MNYKNLNLKPGEVALFNTSSNTYYKFHNIIEAVNVRSMQGEAQKMGGTL